MKFLTVKYSWTSGVASLLLLILLSTSLFSSAHAAATSNGITGPANAVFRAGMWVDDNYTGSSWEINTIGDSVYAFWSTFDENGEPTWYFAQGQLQENIFAAPLQTFSWDYGSSAVDSIETVGALTITFHQSQLAEVDWSLGESQGSRDLKPFIFSSDPALRDRSGFWFEPKDPSYGIGVQTQGEGVFSILYYYNSDGKPVWASGYKGKRRHIQKMFTFSGACPGCEYAPPSSVDAGELLLYFIGQSKMRVKITFPEAAPYWARANARNVMLSNPPSGRPHPAALANLTSEAALKYYYRAGFMEQGDVYYSSQYCYFGPIVSPAPPVSPDSSAIITGTNIQVEGVEEADVIKTTEDFIYSLDYNRGEVGWTSQPDEDMQQSITSYKISADGQLPTTQGKFQALIPSQLANTGSYIQNQGLYHYQNEDAGSRQLTYVVTQSEGGCWSASKSSTFIFNYDSGPETDYQLQYSLQFDGELVTSRRVGNKLFLAISHRPNLRALATELYTEEEYQNLVFDEALVDEIFSQVEPARLLPKIYYPDGRQVNLVDINNIMMPELSGSNLDPVLTSLVMLDLDDLSAMPESFAVMGRIDGMYATPESAYFASSKSEYKFVQGNFVRNGNVNTDIHKISIQGEALEYRGSGTVEGRMGNDPTRLAYRMSEYQGNLRVLSDDEWGDRWGDWGKYRLSILAESTTEQLLLDQVAAIPNQQRPQPIGKPGELLYAMRFYGERAYAVTFEMIDPLYVFDLSDATDPIILGELEIEGFSDYLHPVGDNLLIGIGMYAVSSLDPPVSWLQGVQVGLFDISSPTNPELLDTYIAGFRGSHTIVSNSPHAFTLLPADADSGRPLRFVIPLLEHGPADGIVQPSPSYYYPWKSTGTLMFEIGQNGVGQSELQLVAQATIASSAEVLEPEAGYYQTWDPDSARSVIYGDQLLHYFRGGLFSTPWSIDDFQMAVDCELCQPR